MKATEENWQPGCIISARQPTAQNSLPETPVKPKPQQHSNHLWIKIWSGKIKQRSFQIEQWGCHSIKNKELEEIS